MYITFLSHQLFLLSLSFWKVFILVLVSFFLEDDLNFLNQYNLLILLIFLWYKEHIYVFLMNLEIFYELFYRNFHELHLNYKISFQVIFLNIITSYFHNLNLYFCFVWKIQIFIEKLLFFPIFILLIKYWIVWVNFAR